MRAGIIVLGIVHKNREDVKSPEQATGLIEESGSRVYPSRAKRKIRRATEGGMSGTSARNDVKGGEGNSPTWLWLEAHRKY